MALTRRATLTGIAAALSLPWVRPSYAAAGSVNIYSWSEYIGETTLADFEAETGITPIYDTYSSYEDGEAKLLAGSTGYDVVDVAGRSMPMLVKAGLFDTLDRNLLPLWSNLDPDLLKILDAWDAGLAHCAPYMWGLVGFAFNVDLIKARLPDADLTNLDTILKPENAAKLAYAVPKTGAPLWFDGMAVPVDAPNKANAHAFLNFLMKPEVIAKCTDFIGYANANKAANAFVDPAVLADPFIYPDAKTQSRIWAPKALNEEQERALTRIFQDIKSG